MNPSLGSPLETSCYKGSWTKTPYSERACSRLRVRITRLTQANKQARTNAIGCVRTQSEDCPDIAEAGAGQVRLDAGLD
jgi:hypothetical protein